MENKGFLKRGWQWLVQLNKVKKALLALLVLLAFFLVRLPVTFTVLDAETRKPIEGAVAIAMWDTTSGLPGLISTHTFKAIEAVSDANGKLRYPFFFGRAAIFRPHVKVYKFGYVGWDSKRIYLGCYEENPKIEKIEKRENFVLGSQDILLEKWNEKYTHISHASFIRANTNLYRAGLVTSIYNEAVKEEIPFVTKELKTIDSK